MTNDGKNILNNVKQMKIIFKDISRLLETVDDLMEKNGWNPAWKTQKNLCLLQTSTSLKKPHQWMPSEIFRFYKKNDGYKLSFVSILLDDDIDEWYTILEPLITAGYIKGKEDLTERLDYGWPRIYGYMGKEEHDGKSVSFKEEIEDAKEKDNPYAFESGEGFGWPLTSIKNTEDIQNKIIIPLIKLLKEK